MCNLILGTHVRCLSDETCFAGLLISKAHDTLLSETLSRNWIYLKLKLFRHFRHIHNRYKIHAEVSQNSYLIPVRYRDKIFLFGHIFGNTWKMQNICFHWCSKIWPTSPKRVAVLSATYFCGSRCIAPVLWKCDNPQYINFRGEARMWLRFVYYRCFKR
jgi:hypothetical protein